MENKKVGYARVSTAGQDESAQIAALKSAGCVMVFHERISTRVPKNKRVELINAIASLLPGDTLVIAKLDRLGRSQHEIIALLHELQSSGFHIETLDGLINTRGLGKLAPIVIGLLTGLAEVERSLIQERTLESIAYRKIQGLSVGGRPKVYCQDQADLVRELRSQGLSYRKIAKSAGLSLGVIQRILNC